MFLPDARQLKASRLCMVDKLLLHPWLGDVCDMQTWCEYVIAEDVTENNSNKYYGFFCTFIEVGIAIQYYLS